MKFATKPSEAGSDCATRALAAHAVVAAHANITAQQATPTFAICFLNQHNFMFLRQLFYVLFVLLFKENQTHSSAKLRAESRNLDERHHV